MRVRKKIHSEMEQEELQPAVEELEEDFPEEPEEEIPEELETDVPDDPEPEPPKKGLKAFFARLTGKKSDISKEEDTEVEIFSSEENTETELSDSEDVEEEEISLEIIEEEASEEIAEYTEYTELQDAPEEMPDFGEDTVPQFAMDMEEVITIDKRPDPEQEKFEEKLAEFEEFFADADREEEDEEEEEEELNPDGTPKKSFVSAAIPIALILVIGLGFAYCFQLGLFDEKEVYHMPDLVGRNYYELGEDYVNFDIQVVEEAYSAYDVDVIYAQDIPEGMEVKQGQTVNIGLSLGYATTPVPDVRNYQFEYAQKLLEQSGFKTTIVYELSLNGTAANNVIRTLPASGDEVNVGSEITMYVSEGLGAEMAQVQDFTNMLLEDAIDLCEMYGLEVEAVPVPALQAENVVVEQSIEAGTSVSFHTIITLAYSTGEQPSGIVPYQVNFPPYASGRFILDFINKDGTVIASSDVIVAGFSAGSSVPVEGIGSQEITVILNNYSTNLQTELGKYHFDFSTGTYTIIEEDMQAAFEAVEGIAQ